MFWGANVCVLHATFQPKIRLWLICSASTLEIHLDRRTHWRLSRLLNCGEDSNWTTYACLHRQIFRFRRKLLSIIPVTDDRSSYLMLRLARTDMVQVILHRQDNEHLL